MDENSKYFILAYSSPLLQRDWLAKLGLKGEKEASIALVREGIIPEGADI